MVAARSVKDDRKWLLSQAFAKVNEAYGTGRGTAILIAVAGDVGVVRLGEIYLKAIVPVA